MANAATGDEGLRRARCQAAITAEAVGCPDDEVLVASTGVIGVQLPLENFEAGVPQAAAQLAATPNAALRAANAIMTTDTQAKSCAVTFDGGSFGFPGQVFTVGGMAKGSGMIMPNMATMIAVLTTDAPLASPDLSVALKAAVGVSFNKVTVDSDTSTNDTAVVRRRPRQRPDQRLRRIHPWPRCLHCGAHGRVHGAGACHGGRRRRGHTPHNGERDRRGHP